MTEQDSIEPIRRDFSVQVSVEQAFSLFTDELTIWWPSEYTWARGSLETISIEPGEGGRCFERGPYNFECDWGRVLEWNPPHQLVFTWQISPSRVPEPNPAKASVIEVRFEQNGSQAAIVKFEHRDFVKHGEGAAEYRSAMDSEQGWDYIFSRNRKAAEK